MKYLTEQQRHEVIGPYFAPHGLYDYIRSLPFLGRVSSDASKIVAGSWTEIVVTYEVGGAGLADGAWIKGCFKFYSDWALFQTSNPEQDNYVSATYVAGALCNGQAPATVQSLGVRFDQKAGERPFQKGVIVDIIDGYLNPGDKIIIRLGDKRWGGRGTRVQTFTEHDFRWRFYIDPLGTSKFAPLQPDVVWDIVPGPAKNLKIISPRLARPTVSLNIHAHVEDIWGNVTRNLAGVMTLKLRTDDDNPRDILTRELRLLPTGGWTTVKFDDILASVANIGNLLISVEFRSASLAKESIQCTGRLTVSADIPLDVPRVLFGDLHVHSDDTVGTGDSLYNFSYGRDVAGLDVLGYTANDFQITATRWDATVKLIDSLNDPGSFVIFPGTEWCGNSAAGGDHNVIFLAHSQEKPTEFPIDRHGNIARSFEWSEDGPDALEPGAWPLEDVYATYAEDADSHLMIPHVGGRRCNLTWHHPRLERLLEIGSAWGQFEWLLRDALQRGWKMGVCANSDEHRGRCGGGVPGTAVFGTKGGLTGILADKCERGAVAKALRARHTFATTGSRLVGIIATEAGHLQGDELDWPASKPLRLRYHFLGDSGFKSLSALDKRGPIWTRDLFNEIQGPRTVARVSWGGARLYDRYREGVWNGAITVSSEAAISAIHTFGGLAYNPEDAVMQTDARTVRFASRTSGDVDGVHLHFESDLPETISISGTLGGYVKVGNPLHGNPHKAQPEFELVANQHEYVGSKRIDISGGAELYVAVEAVPEGQLPYELAGDIQIAGQTGEEKAIYFVAEEAGGDKVVTSPLFVKYT